MHISGMAGLVFSFSIALFGLRRDPDQQKDVRISVTELKERMTQREPFVILDLRHPLDVLAAPQLIPGAIPIKPDELDLDLGKIQHGSEIVLYCTCPNEETSLDVRRQLVERGFQDVKVLTGGLPAWKREKLPLEELYPELEQQLRTRVTAKG
jgi:rhodanese-related sulfurtransferase